MYLLLLPWDRADASAPARWDTALATAAQVIGGAAAVVFALLAIPVQNAAAKYSPLFLTYIRRDRTLWGLFGWVVVSLEYSLAALVLGATPWRVVFASFLTVTVILALGLAALRVMTLLNPLELARMLEADARHRTPKLMAMERSQVDLSRQRVEAATGLAPTSLRGHYPTPTAVVEYLLGRLQALLGIAAGGIQSGQVDVVGATLTSVTNIVHTYLQEQGSSATFDDPLVARVSEDFFTLAQSSQQATTQQILPEVVRAIGRLAASGIDVSTPAIGPGEQNVGLMPIGHLHLVGVTNLGNINSIAPSLAVEQLGSVTYRLLQRGLPASTSGVIRNQLSPVTLAALRPGAYHVAGTGAKWLMHLWTLASQAPGGGYVRDAILDATEVLLRSYRSLPVNDERRIAVAPIIYPSFSTPGAALPAGAAVAAGLIGSHRTPEPELMEDVKKLGDRLVRELVWIGTDEAPDWLDAKWATEQTVEMAVLLSAVATGTLHHEVEVQRVRERDHDTVHVAQVNFTGHGVAGVAAEGWTWLSRVLLGTCGCLKDATSPRDIGDKQWPAFQEALSGVSGCILAALAVLQLKGSRELEQGLEQVLGKFCESAEELEAKWGEMLWETNPVIQHLRMVGSWLHATGRKEWAERIARIMAGAHKAPRTFDLPEPGRWGGKYPGDLFSEQWQPPFVSVITQGAVPHYLGKEHPFASDEARAEFEQLVSKVKDEGKST